MRIALVYDRVNDQSAPDQQDVMAQATAVKKALFTLGHQSFELRCGLDLSDVGARLAAIEPDLVFNLVESLAGHGRLIHLFPSFLDAMAMGYTGSSAESLFQTSNKIIAKRQLAAAGLPTPVWIGPAGRQRMQHVTGSLAPGAPPPAKWIVKSVWEHASVGLDETAFVDGGRTGELMRDLVERAPRLGGDCFAEAFIDGREINISMIEGRFGPEVLPPAEIIFEGFEEGKPRIVDYRAKWDPASYAYNHTPRMFLDHDAEGGLTRRLSEISQACWRLFGLRGYARVDFRVEPDGTAWILEINANPCLSPDAGFAAAVHAAGMTFTDAVARIIDCCYVK